MLEDFYKNIQMAEGLNEQEVEMTPELALQIINNSLLYPQRELENGEGLTTKEYETTYDKYTLYGLDYEDDQIMLYGDYKNLIKDLVGMFENSLTDGFEQFINTDLLYNECLKDQYYVTQMINMINKFKNEDLYNIELKDTVDLNGITYAIVNVNLHGI